MFNSISGIAFSTPTSKSLLDHVRTESLQQLISDIQYENCPPGLTGIAGLDKHLFESIQHHASAASSLNRGDVIEIQGEPGSGKTHLVYYLAATCLLPTENQSVCLEGWNKAVIILDTDGTFDIDRLFKLLVSRLTRALPSVQEGDLEETAKNLMRKVHLFRPTSSLQLAATILNLPNYHSKHLPDDEIGLLAIDSISAFYWQDRFTLEQLRVPGAHAALNSNVMSVNPLHHILSSLQRFRISHSPVIVLSNWSLFGTNADKLNPPTSQQPIFYRQHLQPFPNPFNVIDSHRSHTVSGAPFGKPEEDSGSRLFPLTHHITLNCQKLATSSQPASVIEDPSGTGRLSSDQNDGITSVMGYVRTPGYPRIGRFAFTINREEILVGNAAGVPGGAF